MDRPDIDDLAEEVLGKGPPAKQSNLRVVAPPSRTKSGSESLGLFRRQFGLKDLTSTFSPHPFFLVLAAENAARQIFALRRLCKQWRDWVDSMSNAEWEHIFRMHVWVLSANRPHAPASGWDELTPVQERITIGYQVAQQAEGRLADHAGFCLRAAIERGAPADFLREGQVLEMLDALEDVAVYAACEGGNAPGQRFARFMDNAVRGYAYYATFRASSNKVAALGSVSVDLLSRWWRSALARVQSRVEARMVNGSHGARTMARVEVQSFVDKMVTITFHGRKTRDEPDFAMVADELMSAWRWPIDQTEEVGQSTGVSCDPLECLGLYGEKNESGTGVIMQGGYSATKGDAGAVMDLMDDVQANESKRSLKAGALARLRRVMHRTAVSQR